MAVKPIKPSEVAGLKELSLPEKVIEAFNELIAGNYYDGESSFTKNEVLKRIVSKGIPEGEVRANHWLDVEPLYEKAGWEVIYDKPGYNETYEARFIFKSKRSRK